MIPLRDTVRTQNFPWVNYTLITLNIICFFIELGAGPHLQRMIIRVGLIPIRFRMYHDTYEMTTIITSMFMHGGWWHLLFNMLALWIFGDNVEDRLGPARYLIFYLLCGIAAAMVHVYFNWNAWTPIVGASGAIAGVLGAYIFLYPRARVVTLIPVVIFPLIVEIPAAFYLGMWFLAQLLNGYFAIATTAQTSGGVAWWAHTGGFAAGALLLPAFLYRPQRRRVEEFYI